MQTFDEIVPQIFQQLADGRLVYEFGPDVPIFCEGRNEPADGKQFQLELEPMLGGGFMIALYENDPQEAYPVLMWPGKLPMHPILRRERHFTDGLCTCNTMASAPGPQHAAHCPMKVWPPQVRSDG